MKVGITKLRDWFPERRKDLGLGEAHQIITRFYCAPLNLEGACPRRCALCKPRLANMFNLAEARKPAALLTYNARREAALAKEEARKPEAKPSPDVYDNVNPFDLFLEKL